MPLKVYHSKMVTLIIIFAFFTSIRNEYVSHSKIYTPGPKVNPQIRGNRIKVAHCLIAIKEDIYLPEYIQYYKDIGVDHFYIYDNSGNMTADKVVSDPQTTIIPFEGRRMQMLAYTDCLHHYGADYDWMGFFDVDEFLVLKKHESIQQLLSEIHQDGWCGGACVNWRFFGDSGLINEDRRCVTQRFVYRQKGINPHVKCFARTSSTMSYSHPHYPKLHDSFSQFSLTYWQFFNTSGPFFEGGEIHEPVAVLHHYCTKTKSEYEAKVARGRSDTGTVGVPYDIAFQNFNRDANEVFDDSAWTLWQMRRSFATLAGICDSDYHAEKRPKHDLSPPLRARMLMHAYLGSYG